MRPPPVYRAPRRALTPEEMARLAEMRRRGATWHEIGRAFGKQEGVCRRLFQKAQAGTGGLAAPARPPADPASARPA